MHFVKVKERRKIRSVLSLKIYFNQEAIVTIPGIIAIG